MAQESQNGPRSKGSSQRQSSQTPPVGVRTPLPKYDDASFSEMKMQTGFAIMSSHVIPILVKLYAKFFLTRAISIQ